MTLAEELKKFESEYYQIKYGVFHDSYSNKWMGKVRVYRKDTGEEIDAGLRVVDQEKNIVKEKMFLKINSSFKEEMSELGIPFEWKSPVRPILVSCLKFSSFITEFGSVCDEAIAGEKNDTQFTNEYVTFWNKLIKKTLTISKDIEKLTEQERIEILTSPESVFEDPGDSWNLDDLTYRNRVFKFFLNPSQAEIDAHQTQSSTMKDRFHELGWDDE